MLRVVVIAWVIALATTSTLLALVVAAQAAARVVRRASPRAPLTSPPDRPARVSAQDEQGSVMVRRALSAVPPQSSAGAGTRKGSLA